VLVTADSKDAKPVAVLAHNIIAGASMIDGGSLGGRLMPDGPHCCRFLHVSCWRQFLPNLALLRLPLAPTYVRLSFDLPRARPHHIQ
jgi:hypothetical protein